MKLFEPLTIRGMSLKNRIVMAPMQVGINLASKRAQAYYVERARGGAGAITTGAITVDTFLFNEAWGKPGGAETFNQKIGSLASLIHGFDVKIGVQLVHLNRLPLGLGRPIVGEAVGPSGGNKKPSSFDPATTVRGLTVEEIRFIVWKFGQAAEKVKQAGFDFVEFHAAHSYLPCQFFTPNTNHRIDRYGGDLTGRMRFGRECVAAMRKTVGNNFPIFVRLGMQLNGPSNLTLEDYIFFACELVNAGADVISVSTVANEPIATPGYSEAMGVFLPFAEAIKRRVPILVMAVGRIHSGELAEDALSHHKADLIAVGRQLIADPSWPEKIAKGENEGIIPCLSCNTCIDTAVMGATQLRCSVNPRATREINYNLKPGARIKKVYVIGGGPAGMYTAMLLARHGQDVTLFNNERELGGQLLAAAQAPYKERIGELKKYLINQLAKLRVKLVLGENVMPNRIVGSDIDMVVVATGASPVVPKIEGISKVDCLTASDVLRGRSVPEGKIAVIGGGMVGCEVAEYLAQRHRDITILEMLGEIASNVGAATKEALILRMKDPHIKIETNVNIIRIAPGKIIANICGKDENIPADTIVLAAGYKPNKEIASKLSKEKIDIHLIGDCLEPRKIVDAFEDGLSAASKILG